MSPSRATAPEAATPIERRLRTGDAHDSPSLGGQELDHRAAEISRAEHDRASLRPFGTHEGTLASARLDTWRFAGRRCVEVTAFSRRRASAGIVTAVKYSRDSPNGGTLALKHPKARTQRAADLAIAPHFSLETTELPRHRLPEGEMAPDVAYQIVHDELMLDGNARLNVATFVSTWMEPQAEKLMAECFDKNMIDKDEYPQTAEIEMRCVNILADLWHAPEAEEATGCSTTGSSEAAMLGGLALKRRWQKRRAAEGKPADKPNLVMGINVQVCWEKFANYWDVEMRLVPMEGDRFTLSAEEAVARCDENTIGVVAILGSTFDGAYEPVKEICDALDAFEKQSGLDIPVHVDGASGAMIAPFLDPDLEWDFRLPSNTALLCVLVRTCRVRRDRYLPWMWNLARDQRLDVVGFSETMEAERQVERLSSPISLPLRS